MFKSKKTFIIMGIIILLISIVGVSIAFFNYTRTGNANTVRVGRVAFNSNQTETVSLTNIFPIASADILMDTNNTDEAVITITGDTTYNEGVEYLVKIVNVNNKVNGKTVPINIDVSITGLGTSDSSYYTNRSTAESSIYKVIADDKVYTNNDLVVGYITPGVSGINGSIKIKAYLDKDKIGISDTYDGTETDNMRTTIDWVDGRTILTTSEWNSLTTNGISFQVQVEANEGIWVNDKKIVMKSFYYSSDDTLSNGWKSIRENVTSVEFSTAGVVPQNAITSFDVTDVSSTHPVTLYILDDGLGNNTYKVIIVSEGIIYAPENSQSQFAGMSKLITFDSTNFKVDDVTSMQTFFGNDYELQNIDTLANWNTANVGTMRAMFQNNYQLSNISALTNWNTANVQSMRNMFLKCSLINLNAISKWNVEKVEDMYQLFAGTTLEDISGVSNWRTLSVANMYGIFSNQLKIKNLNALTNWNVEKVNDYSHAFHGCTGLTDVSGINDWYIKSTATFTQMFKSDSIHPTFTQVQGTWDNNGTFIPSA